ncbi:Alpha/Beta hydrolase protein [Xylogone sp. PMI_703]|nr:Alpha/Beta hydrolase protein [Xylogone sp. PMI_703]
MSSFTRINGVNGANSHDTLESREILAELRDLTHTEVWKNTEAFFTNIHAPSFGKPSNAGDLAISPDGKQLAFTGHVWNSLQGNPRTQLYLLNISHGEPKSKEIYSPVAITGGLHNDKKPKWSPDGKTLAFLSDRIQRGQYQLFCLRSDQIQDAQLLTLTPLDGIVEDFAWSSDGGAILIGLAGFGLPKSGFEGSGTLLDKADEDGPSWMPSLETDHPATNVRSLWVHDIRTQQTRRLSLPGRNVWRFSWCGLHDAIALVSDRPTEGAYKDSDLVKMSISDGTEQVLIQNNKTYLMTELTASPSGSTIALIESVGGDRTKLAGSIICIDRKTNNRLQITPDVDIAALQWINDETILAMGLRDLSSVALGVNISTQKVRELWTTTTACGPSYPQHTAIPNSNGGFAIVRQGWELAPEIGLVDSDGKYQMILSFEHDGTRWLKSQLGQSHRINWKSSDGLNIQGFLYLPSKKQERSYPLILNVHGGPMSAFVDQWMGYRAWVAFLVAHGYAVLNANPRGSLGRGRAFTEGVVGDIGGGDAQDLLSGLDDLVNRGIADPSRLGVIGGSYGGYQSAWLTTLTDRFAAAIPISPVSDWNLGWLSSDLRQRILDNRPYDLDSLYFSRSPLRQVGRCKTPTLQLVGALDQCTPPAQAHYYHVALKDHGVKSCIVEYPQEGHGIRQFPALIDACCRMLSWFDHYMSVNK